MFGQPTRAVLVAGLFISLAWLYATVLIGLAGEWVSNPDASYGVLLAALAVGVAWKRRTILVSASTAHSGWLGGFCVFALGLATYLAGMLAPDVYLTRVSFVVVLTGMTWFLTGRRSIQAIVAPLIFLLLAVPLPALLVNTATLPLQLVASRMAESLLSLIAIPVFRDGNLLVLPSGTLEVAEACSGLRSLVSLAALGGVLAWAADGSMVRRGALVLLAVPIAIVMNGLRIAVTGAVVERWGIPLATGNWHLLTGWITFVVSLGGLLVAERGLSSRCHDSSQPSFSLS